MESREGLLISIIDTASHATTGMAQIDLLIADLLAGADLNLVCSQILRITNETRAAVQFERSLAERQMTAEA
ncbi:hypothetical protein [Pseudomonas sp. OTU750018]|uniref:hypothetical protein n=1 Tax=Pseudomonas sp. OTU750018 TaxID=2709708 RepID=UPI0014245F59|nr:hypothetical protein [Pseudomonas sp. OTU750018]